MREGSFKVLLSYGGLEEALGKAKAHLLTSARPYISQFQKVKSALMGETFVRSRRLQMDEYFKKLNRTLEEAESSEGWKRYLAAKTMPRKEFGLVRHESFKQLKQNFNELRLVQQHWLAEVEQANLWQYLEKVKQFHLTDNRIRGQKEVLSIKIYLLMSSFLLPLYRVAYEKFYKAHYVSEAVKHNTALVSSLERENSQIVSVVSSVLYSAAPSLSRNASSSSSLPEDQKNPQQPDHPPREGKSYLASAFFLPPTLEAWLGHLSQQQRFFLAIDVAAVALALFSILSR